MLQNVIFVVDNEPYCIWEVDIVARNIEFLRGIDTEYFDYVLNVHLDSDDEKRAAIALRATLHHAMETMFSLLCAYIQAPNCAYAWLAKCSNNQLRQLISKIGIYNNGLYTGLNVERVSWESVSQLIFQFYKPDTERNKQTTTLFASLWNRLAYEYTNINHIDEYNSIKHGFRVRSGGFSLAIGEEHEYGVAPPESEMKMIGSSEYGTTFYKIETIGLSKSDRSVRSRRTSVNWKIEKVALLIQLVSMSISNIVSALKIVNGAPAETCQFRRPEEDSDFDKPWLFSPGITSCNMDFVINADDIVVTTRGELIEKINGKKKNTNL